MKIKNVLVEVDEFRTLSSLIDELMSIKEEEGDLTVVHQFMIPLADKDSVNYKVKLESK